MESDNRYSVLLIESQTRTREHIEEVLKNIPNLSVFTVNSAKKAEYLLQYRYFDLIICDTQLKDTDGKIFCCSLKKEQPKTTTKVLLLAHQEDIEEMLDCLGHGADSVLPFPLNSKLFILTVRRMCGIYPKKYRKSISRRGIDLYPQGKYLMYRDIRIFLTDAEVLIMYLLLRKDAKVKSPTICKYISEKQNIEVSLDYLTVLMSRLRKKLRNSTGLEVIKNRYRDGYYIAI